MAVNNGGPAFPVQSAAEWQAHGMTLRDYAEIHFASAWAIALGTSDMADSRESRTAEANRLGRIQADEFIAARDEQEKQA